MSQANPHIEDKLLDFAYGELPSAEARAVEAHLKSCPACSGALESIQGVRRVMSHLPAETAPETGLESLMGYAEQAARRASAGPVPKPTWWRRWIAPVAGVAALVVVGVVFQTVSAKRAMQPDVLLRAAPAAVEQKAEGPASPTDNDRMMNIPPKVAESPPAPPPADAPTTETAPAEAAAPAAMPTSRTVHGAKSLAEGGAKPKEPGYFQDELAKKDLGGADDSRAFNGIGTGGRVPAEKSATGSGEFRRKGKVADLERARDANADGVTSGDLIGEKEQKAGSVDYKSTRARAENNKMDSPPRSFAAADKAPQAPAGVAATTPAPEAKPYRASPPAVQWAQPAQPSPATSSPYGATQAQDESAVAAESKVVVAREHSRGSKNEESQRDDAGSWSRLAQQAHDSGDFASEANYLRRALVVASSTDAPDLLLRLCDAEASLRQPMEACDRLRSQYASSYAMRKLRSRGAMLDDAEESTVSASKKARREALPPATPPAKAAPPMPTAAPTEKANSL